MRKMLLSLLFASAAVSMTNAQTDSTFNYNVETGAAFGSGTHAPLWLTANADGMSSIKKSSGYLRASMFKENDYSTRFSWNAGADMAVAGGYTSTFIVNQLYAGVRWRCLDLTLGSKAYHSEFVDKELSSGDMLFSGNSRPVPQARAGIFRYTYIPGTMHKLAVRGYVAFGMFTDQDWQYTFTQGKHTRNKKALYHSKALFLRWGDTDKMPLTVEGGLEMAAQWGGKVYLSDGTIINPGHSFKDMMKIFFASSSSSADPSLSPDAANVAGNQLGEWSLALGWTDKKRDFAARLYYQHFFEDHSQMFFDYLWRDMLLGFEVKLPKNRFVSKFLYEYLITRDQSGPVYNDTNANNPEQVSGRDNYYNNWLYGAWQHWGQAIGNPLLRSPLYNADGIISFQHNRVKAHHFGVQGNPFAGFEYKLRMSYVRSWGTYSQPTAEVTKAFSAALQLTYRPERLKGWGAGLGIGLDRGAAYYGRNFGANISISKTGWL